MSDCTAGTISGNVHAEGRDNEIKNSGNSGSSSGAYDSRAYKFATKTDYTAMHEFVVSLEGTFDPKSFPASNQVAQVVPWKISQHKARFEPHILTVLKGTTVEWPNNDDIFHNVFSYSETKQFDLGLYKNPEIKSVTFDTCGRVDVFCSIHSSMSCVVLVLDNPYFTKTDQNGDYKLLNVPPGKYTVKVWHERLPAQRMEVIVPDTGEVKMNFTMGIKGLPKI
jgi:plastocyanin